MPTAASACGDLAATRSRERNAHCASAAIGRNHTHADAARPVFFGEASDPGRGDDPISVGIFLRVAPVVLPDGAEYLAVIVRIDAPIFYQRHRIVVDDMLEFFTIGVVEVQRLR